MSRGMLPPHRPAPLALALRVSLALVIGSLAFAVWARPAAPTPPPIDRRLILHRRVSAVRCVLDGGARVNGTLYPTLPGLNTLRLTLGHASREAAAGQVRVVVTMPGMAMPPVAVTLSPRAGRYQGAIALPMFGHYAARVTVLTAHSRFQGTLTLDVPLSLRA